MSDSIITVQDATRLLIDTATANVRREFASSVASLYSRDENGKAIHAGSCSFVEQFGERFLVSARHVFEHVNYSDVHILTAAGLEQLEIDANQTMPTTSGEPDMLDLLVAKLDERHRGWASSVTFIDLNWACHLANIPNRRFQMIGLLGFPHSKNKPNTYLNRIRAQPVFVSGPSRQRHNLPRSSKFADQNHVFMKYESKRARHKNGQVGKAIKPQGMSGGLMIDLGILGNAQELAQGPQLNPIPVGIVTNWISSAQVVAGTRFSRLKAVVTAYQGGGTETS